MLIYGSIYPAAFTLECLYATDRTYPHVVSVSIVLGGVCNCVHPYTCIIEVVSVKK